MASADNPDAPSSVVQQQRQQQMFKDYSNFISTSTLAACVVAPVLIALPPRKLDLFTFSLAGAFVLSANHQVKERTGLGLMGHASKQFVSRSSARPSGAVKGEQLHTTSGTTVLEQKAREAWNAGNSAGGDWKTQRMREEQEKLDQGEGYGSMIVDQIWEVWNQGETNVEELKKKDEEAVQQKEAQSTNNKKG